ncbi:DUF6480 family protein [Streptomyces montanisoli]|uniref:Uncharacterized protein n=1 Tax=Streptomyces montanisoli TaxID=2798581 RepID=A0A940MI74_9ACTN|nr:DUF6480 family protein [Streptomyces montanisoli]MBP0460691.1 hypothetical protein [Streptomyces montanisoli]
MTASNPDPEPRTTTGLAPGGGVPPGETPPGEDSMSEAGPRHVQPRGWATGPLLTILVCALLLVLALGFSFWFSV